MANKFVEVNEKIAEGVVEGYKKIEDGVVGGYNKIEKGAVASVAFLCIKEYLLCCNMHNSEGTKTGL